MKHHAIFAHAVHAAVELPQLLREHAGAVASLEEVHQDKSYIEFLDTQIHLSPRGPEWTEVLKRRRKALLPFCSLTLLRGAVRVGGTHFSVYINPKTTSVVHWEEYE
jgi:hypothetical protein